MTTSKGVKGQNVSFFEIFKLLLLLQIKRYGHETYTYIKHSWTYVQLRPGTYVMGSKVIYESLGITGVKSIIFSKNVIKVSI